MIWPFSSPTYTVDHLRRHHAPASARIHAQAFAHGWSAETLERLILDGACLGHAAVAANSRDVAGFVLSRRAADEAEILTIAVDSGARRHGIGRLLLETHLPALAQKGVNRLFLEVDGENRAALGLYRGFAFEQVGRREGYYAKTDGTRAAALVLRRDLS